ncbi:phosphatase PAP2 family protein [Pseudogracilibacillus auburnensis]|uniref:Undecaprenyl-diphosphatase n=1 Tax=Pseudogracilibacillus auburnensis TaxID=1494959 RepID=A0A2V3WAK5_9BACI|nr:phosphatase PAP2 family protein [Pseudogracilibacillus auburnensis]MBO1003721.1 phosphatase PAP2 family protein [Pseudogracilibacillus auburnensis]PXW90268.1 undecaprenyl-diphosphatase [Pseudogracilibacillus auburnensis]
MERIKKSFYEMECQLFRNVNQYFDRKYWNTFFRTITHCGGATFTISTLLLMMVFGTQAVQLTAFAGAISLAVSHIPVAALKKMYPRRRPYLVLEKINVTDNPLKDHSFPSGHTTAIFSVIVPFGLFMPAFMIVLMPLGFTVGISRMYLGLHYPSDVLAGIVLGSSMGLFSFLMMKQFFPYVFS